MLKAAISDTQLTSQGYNGHLGGLKACQGEWNHIWYWTLASWRVINDVIDIRKELTRSQFARTT